MKKLFATALVLSATFAWTPPAAAQASEAKPVTPQQQRMRDCNREAEGMKGQERKDFMKACLSGKQAENKAAREEYRAERKAEREERREERQKARSEAQAAQQEKMTTCNADAKAKGLTGDARKAFMSDCLKAK